MPAARRGSCARLGDRCSAIVVLPFQPYKFRALASTGRCPTRPSRIPDVPRNRRRVDVQRLKRRRRRRRRAVARRSTVLATKGLAQVARRANEGADSARALDIQRARSHRERTPCSRCIPQIRLGANPPARSRAVLAGVRSVAPCQVTRSARARWVCEEVQSGRGRRRRVAR